MNPCQLSLQAVAGDLRIDRGSSEIVEHGIALQRDTGTVCALEYLKSRGVVAEVIERVLLHPQQRRQAGAGPVMHKN